MFKEHLKQGYGYAYITVFLFAMYNVIAKVAVTYDVHPAIFVAIGSIASSLALFVYAGPGRLSFSALVKPHTIFYSILNLLEHLFTLHLFMYVAGSEGSLMQRANIAFALLIALFLGRRPSKLGMFGLVLTQIGVVGIICQVDESIRYQALAYLIVVVICQTSKTFISETHPTSNNTKSNKEHARVTAFVMFVSSMVFFIALLLAASFREVGAVTGEFASALPTFKDFIHPITFVMALIFGILNDAPASYYHFYSTKTIKSENFISICALIPLITYVMEWALQAVGILEVRVFGLVDWVFITFIIVGSIIMTIKKSKETVKINDKEEQANIASQDRLTATMVHFDGNMRKACTALELSEKDLVDIKEGHRKATPEELELIHENFEGNVKACDPVTGLDNRLIFFTQTAQLERAKTPYVLLYLDLNKFKPVNDTYGHKAGDLVLECIGNRLEANYGHIAAISRLGGDEFCIMFIDYEKEEAEQFIAEVKALIRQPMFFDSVGEVITVGCAVGSAAYPVDGSSAKELLDIADEFMFADKEGEGR